MEPASDPESGLTAYYHPEIAVEFLLPLLGLNRGLQAQRAETGKEVTRTQGPHGICERGSERIEGLDRRVLPMARVPNVKKEQSIMPDNVNREQKDLQNSKEDLREARQTGDQGDLKDARQDVRDDKQDKREAQRDKRD